MSDIQNKFQQLLRELFQFDSANLDFGIYRIMNHKRAVIERFISEDLPTAIGGELAQGALAEHSQAAQALEAARQKVLATLGDDALDAEGDLVESFRNTNVGKEYLETQTKAAGARDRPALEAAIYNHLYTFFSRYYQDGDFISKRRYSKKERYAIPYNGEEVTLYWANHDQYYIKTAEHFTDYTYKAPNGVTVHFKLQAADVEQNNVKGEGRFFLPCLDAIAWDENPPRPSGERTGARRELVIPFEYRPLTAQEAITYGKSNRQEAIIAQALEAIPKRLVKNARALAALTAEQRATADGDPVTYLARHLRQYTRRNTSDFFIHKDLQGFLSRELDFYLKNEVLNLEELEAAGEDLAEGWFQLLRLIKRMGSHIIAFLAQIEDFQKMLWEKRKFVTETFYCITVGNILEAFYPEIAANEAQRREWVRLYRIDELPDYPWSPSPLRGEGRGEGQVKSRRKDQRSALLTYFAREMRQAPTDAEKRLWHFLRNRRLGGYKFRRQHPMGPYIVDFICIEGRLIVELDGGQHNTPEGKALDDERSAWLEAQGFKVLRFWNDEVLKNTAGLLEGIWGELEEAPHPNPLPAGEREVTFLKAHSTLVLDTRHFAPDFVDRLLASFDDLDGMTDGLLVHSENWQALNLLGEKYREQVKRIHIDPPYNTQTSGFLYKNDYQHSSWLAMMENRIAAGASLLTQDGSFLCHIDENEYEILHHLFDIAGIPDAGTVIWDKKNPMLGRKGVATQHEYILWRTQNDSPIYLRPINARKILAKVRSLMQQHESVTDQVRDEFATWIRACEGLSGGERAYRFIDDDGRVFQSVAIGAPEPRTDSKFHIPLIHPVTKKQCPVPPNGWSRTPEHLQALVAKGEIVFGSDETVQPRKKVFLTEHYRRQLSSVIRNASRGKGDVDRLGLKFPYCHPVSLYEELTAAAASGQTETVLDFFAGSGTTGHAVINLNREDGGRRKFILVEMGDYFDTVLLPRIKKVTFTPEWKDGAPKRMATAEEVERSPRLVKVIRLESYEDALNNIAFDEASGQQALRFEDYLLQYMLKWEARQSETLLNVAQLVNPFSYQLHIHHAGETRTQAVDLPETFNVLLGLDMHTRRVYQSPSPLRGEGRGEGTRYLVYRGVTRNGRTVAVIWRETAGWTQEDYQRERDFVAAQKMAEGADELFVNGDSFIPDAQALEGLFKARMFAPVEA